MAAIRARYLWIAPALLLLAVIVAINLSRRRIEPLRIGVLHSLTGTMAISESSVVDATRLAVEEINANGGLLGRPVEIVVADGQSDPKVFAERARGLLAEENVDVIFGCWTSASRKTVRPIVEQLDGLLIYPVQYEGLEQSPNIVYTGAAPNQQIIPAVKWAMDHLGDRVFLVGSDYVFPRTANAIIADQVRSQRGQIVGEYYLPLGSDDVAAIVEAIAAAKPNVIFNTINGDSNVAFFRALRRAGIGPDSVPVISFSIAEEELRGMESADVAGHYAAWNYFQSVDSPENQSFIERFRGRYGADRVTSDPIEAAYFGVHLWAQAVREAGSSRSAPVRKALRGQTMNAPEGIVVIDPRTQHTWKAVRIGRIQPDGQFDIVWDSDKPIRPIPFPIYRTQSQWESFLEELRQGWDGNWSAPTAQSGSSGPARE